jgi:hypothetical protein
MISGLDKPSLLRRATWARVGECEPIRVVIIRHRAWLACRSPPRLSRCRDTLPEEAGIGAAAPQLRGPRPSHHVTDPLLRVRPAPAHTPQ